MNKDFASYQNDVNAYMDVLEFKKNFNINNIFCEKKSIKTSSPCQFTMFESYLEYLESGVSVCNYGNMDG